MTGTYRIAMTSTEPDGQITASLNAVTPRRLDVGSSDPVAAPAAFDVTAQRREPIVFTAAPGTDDAFVDVTVNDPGGFPINSARSLESGNPVPVVIGTGRGDSPVTTGSSSHRLTHVAASHHRLPRSSPSRSSPGHPS